MKHYFTHSFIAALASGLVTVLLAFYGDTLFGNDQAGWLILAVPFYFVISLVGSILIGLIEKHYNKQYVWVLYLPTLLIVAWLLSQGLGWT
jgi:hypothetical protein